MTSKETQRFLSIMDQAAPHKLHERCFEDCDALIHALGARRQHRPWGQVDPNTKLAPYNLEYGVKDTVGDPPSENAQLTAGGVIVTRMHLDSTPDPYAVHEAVHHFHGEPGLSDEGTMMPLEFALYSLVKDQKHRHELLNFFGESFDSNDEVYALVLHQGPQYFKSDTWQTLLASAQPWVTKAGRIRAHILRRLKRRLPNT